MHFERQQYSVCWSELEKQFGRHENRCHFPPIRHPQADPSEICMRKIGKCCRIYCHDAHKKYLEYYGTFKAGSTERCQFQMPTAMLSWYSIVLGLACLKSSFRKGLNKNHGRRPAGKGSKSRLQDEGEDSETKEKNGEELKFEVGSSNRQSFSDQVPSSIRRSRR